MNTCKNCTTIMTIKKNIGYQLITKNISENNGSFM